MKNKNKTNDTLYKAKSFLNSIYKNKELKTINSYTIY